eukprot:1169220_1
MQVDQIMKPSDQPSQLTKELRDALQCPICFYAYRGNIFQCPEGHAICQSCKQSLNEPKRCPSCRSRWFSRNRALEQFISAAKMSCEGAIRGSAEVMSPGPQFVPAAPQMRPGVQRQISREPGIDWEHRTRLYCLREEAKE